VARTALELLDGDDLPISLSFGAAAAAPGVTPAELLRTADTAQYAAKHRGGGRLCTADPAAETVANEDRRQLRSRGLEQRLERAAERAVGLLDVDLARAGTLDRIEAVAVAFAAALDAAAWAISRWERGSTVIRSVSIANDRDTRLRGLRMGLPNEVYRLDEFPQTARLLTEGGGSFVARADDDRTDPAERRLLGKLGFAEAMVAVAPHGSGAYLVEVYGDAQTLDPNPASMRLQLLLRLATAARTAS
jgi:hypothetical protein